MMRHTTALVVLALALPPDCVAASFDCARARSKLNRVICADATLSRLDETVWNAYGERIRALTAMQYAQVRQRHIQWRRGRGLYDNSVEALTQEYANHLAWLNHPYIAAEGRFERAGAGRAAAMLEVDVDIRSPRALVLRGLVSAPVAIAWHAPAEAGAADAATAPPQALTLSVRPQLQGRLAPPSGTCEMVLHFSPDQVSLAADGACGADFSGTYVRAVRE